VTAESNPVDSKMISSDVLPHACVCLITQQSGETSGVNVVPTTIVHPLVAYGAAVNWPLGSLPALLVAPLQIFHLKSGAVPEVVMTAVMTAAQSLSCPLGC